MLLARLLHRRLSPDQRGQALVELALVMPIMVGIVAVLFQFGILFVAYLSLVHEMRDVGRWAAVHPNTVDVVYRSTPPAIPNPPTCADVAAASSLFRQVCDDLPSVVDPNRITLSIVAGTDGATRSCASLTSGACANRPAYSEVRMRLHYDASTIIFLPTDFRIGPWLRVKIPSSLPDYDYSVMVEQH